jgi:phosphomannomutase
MNKFIFDVDGTLTPSRGKIDRKFHNWFLDFTKRNKCWLVTGSDYPKTLEQLGKNICESVHTVYNCNGNDVWFKGKRVNSSGWVLPEDAHEWLSVILTQSQFPLRTGEHFEHRKGLCNFSIVGRGATKEQREQYVEWDKEQNERNEIAEQFNYLFPEIQATVGGETGIDIAPKGADKSQILQDFNDDDFIVFFGDRMDKDGNDYPLALSNYNGANYHVKGWEETWEILRNEYSTNRT